MAGGRELELLALNVTIGATTLIALRDQYCEKVKENNPKYGDFVAACDSCPIEYICDNLNRLIHRKELINRENSDRGKGK